MISKTALTQSKMLPVEHGLQKELQGLRVENQDIYPFKHIQLASLFIHYGSHFVL
jgi:hypothetical protein